MTFLYFPIFVTICYLADIGAGAVRWVFGFRRQVLTMSNLQAKLCPKRRAAQTSSLKA